MRACRSAASTPCSPSVGSPPRATRRGRVGAGRAGADRARRAVAHQARAAAPRGRRAGRRASRRRSSRAAASSSRTRSTRSTLDVAGPRLPRRRRLDRRLHRLPAAARRRAGDRARRRLRAARLAAAQGRPGDRDGARQRARPRARRRCRSQPELVDDRRLLHLAREGARRRSLAALAADVDLLAMVKPQFELGPRAGRQGRGGPRRERSPRGDAIGGRRGRRRRARACAASPRPGCPGRRETARPSSGCAASGDARSRTSRPRSRRSSRERRPSLLTHTQPEQTSAARSRAVARAAETAGWSSWSPRRRAARQARRRRARASASRPSCPRSPTSASCSAATAASSTRCAATPTPACPSSGSTSGPSASSPRSSARSSTRACERAFAGDFEVIDAARAGGRRRRRAPASALNDVSLHPPPARPRRRALLPVGGEEVGHVRCDGLVAATPAGSTGYNLANAGPILAWGVEGFVVSFIAPHTLTARALVVAPERRAPRHATRPAATRSRSRSTASTAGELEPGDEVRDPLPRRRRPASPSSRARTSTSRIREKFGRLAHSKRPASRAGANPSGAAVRTGGDAARAANREPAPDRARRAAPRRGPERDHRRDRGRQDGPRPLARPDAWAARRGRRSSGPAPRRPTSRASSSCPTGLLDDPELAEIAERLPDGGDEVVLGRRVSAVGPHQRLRRRAARPRRRTCRRSARACSPSTASTSTAS